LREWGGGKYKLIGLTAGGKFLKNRTVDLAGDPIFRSETARAQYRRAIGPISDPPPAPASAGPALSVPEILALISGADARKEQDYERRIAEMNLRHTQDMERMRMDAEIRGREAEAREERRAKDEREREVREAARALEARKSEREFQALMVQIAGQQKADPTAALLQGIQIAQQLGGAGEASDPLSLLAGNIPQILDKAGALIPGAKPPAPAAPPAPDTDLHLAGALGAKGSAVVEHLRRIGKSPEAALSGMFDALPAARPTSEPEVLPPPLRPEGERNGARGPGGRTIVQRPDKLTPPAKPDTP
jgi:hypothetical protein